MPWSLLYYPLKIVPTYYSDKVYSFIGRNRYRIFGKRLGKEQNCCKFE
jgi:predicted DCC family thiol-disulfide oxidoreductase YuxK